MSAENSTDRATRRVAHDERGASFASPPPVLKEQRDIQPLPRGESAQTSSSGGQGLRHMPGCFSSRSEEAGEAVTVPKENV
jgi:hypothetical protein